MAILKPLLSKIWANSAPVGDLESPTDPKYAEGWLFGEKPPHKYMNWLQWTFSKALAHLNEYGVLEWDTDTVYPLGAYVWSGGKVYRSREAANQGNVVTLPTKWQEQSLPDMPTSGDGFILYYSGSQLFWKDHQDLDYGTYEGRVAASNASYIMLNDNVIGNDPQVSEINVGELACNFKDKTLFTKTPEGAIIPLSGQASIVDFEFTATAGQTSFAPAGGYTVGQIEVFMNGRKLASTDYVANDGINVVLAVAAELDDLIVVSVWASFGLTDAYTQAQVDGLIAPFNSVLNTGNFLHIQDQKASGVSGGSASAGLQTRVLNVVLDNSIVGASLSLNEVTLPAGAYYIDAYATAYHVNAHQAKLYDETDASTLVVGSSENTSAADDTNTRSVVKGKFTLSATKNVSLKHYIQTARTSDGLGANVTSGEVEVFADVQIWKVG